jgi:hypothetical protein
VTAALAALVVLISTMANAGAMDRASGLSASRLEGNRIALTFESGEFEALASNDGTRLLIERFGTLAMPGKPALPVMRCQIALPPGAKVESARVVRRTSVEVPGLHRIAPYPPIAMLSDLPRRSEGMDRIRREWDMARAAAYQSDLPFPAEIVWPAGQGSYREYRYVSIAFCPFTYHPRSGRLEQHRYVEVVIDLSFPGTADHVGGEAYAWGSDPVAATHAARWFPNYDQIAGLSASSTPDAVGRQEQCDYLIITTADLAGAIAASGFQTWKAALGHTFRTVLTTDSEITGQPGDDLAERIRNFLRTNYLAWGVRYLLIVGGTESVPMRVCYPDPDFHIYNPWDPGLIAPGTPTDSYYADLTDPDSESWDSDGDGYPGEYGEDHPDFRADIAVGRIPIDDPPRITYALNKIVAFEQDGGAWKRNILHGGAILFFEHQDHGDYPFIDGATCLDSIETGLMSGHAITHFSERYGIVQSGFAWSPLTEGTFTSRWGNGQFGVVNWSGHGWCDGAYRTVWAWDDGDEIPESGNGELQSQRFIGTDANYLDDDHPSIVFAISCNVGYPEVVGFGNLGIDLLTLPGWGASVGVVSSARPSAISSDWKHYPGGTEQICFDFNRYLVLENETVGDALYDGKYSATSQYGWDLLYEYMNLYNFNLFGDPSLRIEGGAADVSVITTAGQGSILLRAVGPNPFMNATTLRLDLPSAGPVRVSVHDAGGRQIVKLLDRVLDVGGATFVWDGRKTDGQRAAPGLYVVVCDVGGRRESRKLLLLR